MKVLTRLTRRILVVAFLFALIPLGLADRTAAETPVLARPVSPKHFDRERGDHERGENERDERGKSDRDDRERGERERGHMLSKRFLHPGGDDELNRSKEETTLFAPTAPTTPGVLTPSDVLTGFDGIDESATFADPPDGALAVSNGYVVQVVNTNLSVWTKTYDATGRLSALTRVVSAADLNQMLGTNPNCYTNTSSFFRLVSDPSVDYDAANDRFTLSMISFDQLAFTSSLCVAVTQTGDPSGNWLVYAFPISPHRSLLDFPRAVVGSDGLFYVTGNLFLCCDAAGNPTFDHARVYAFKTSDMYAGGNTSPRFVVVGNDPETATPADSLTPARGMGVSGMYFISANNPASPLAGSLVTLWKWVDPFGTNVFTRQGSVTVSSYMQPPPALQLGGLPAGVTSCMQPGANCIATNDARNLTAYWSANAVWAAHHIGCTQGGTPVACVQWYQLGNLNGAPTLLQQGVVDDLANPGRHRYFPSLAVDLNGNVALAYAYSSAMEYPGVAFTTITPWGA